MSLTLRHRIFLTIVPLLLLLAVIGTVGVVLLLRLGNSADAILRENYVSVVAMERLNEALERIDSSFQFALAGEEDKAKHQYDENWPDSLRELDVEKHNITMRREGELVARLDTLTRQYREQGDAFY